MRCSEKWGSKCPLLFLEWCIMKIKDYPVRALPERMRAQKNLGLYQRAPTFHQETNNRCKDLRTSCIEGDRGAQQSVQKEQKAKYQTLIFSWWQGSPVKREKLSPLDHHGSQSKNELWDDLVVSAVKLLPWGLIGEDREKTGCRGLRELEDLLATEGTRTDRVQK